MKKSTATHLYSVDRYMTPSPHVVQSAASLASARDLMREIGARDLPVLEDGKLVGVLSERDLRAHETLTRVDPSRTPVRNAMQTEVYGVGRDTPLDEVAATMARHDYGAAVVWSGREVVGIFTTVDAMRALADMVRHEMHR